MQREFKIVKGIKIPKRPTWNEFFLNLADDYSLRATCLRRQYGAVIIDKDHFIISAGYCGAPQGVNNCVELGFCFREKEGIPTGQSYEKCVSIHAEHNAIIVAGDKSKLKGTTLFIAGWDVQKQEPTYNPPCINCAKQIVQVGIKNIILRAPEGKIKCIKVEDIVDKLNARDFSYPYDLGSIIAP